MSMRNLVVAVVVSFANNMLGSDILEFLKNKETDGLKYLKFQNTVIITPTNLIVKAGPEGKAWWLRKFPDAEAILTLDRKFVFAEDHAAVIFTPISFKNKLKGFRIDSIFEGRSFGLGVTTNSMYLALSDPPVVVGPEDMDGEIELPPPPPKPKPTPQIPSFLRFAPPPTETEEPLQNTVEEGRATASPPSRFWLCALISFCALSAVLWLAHRKRKHDTKN